MFFTIQFCENCPDFPIMLIGTKSDMWRERQIAVDAGVQTCADYGCANFKEISTKESLDEVAEVFEAALRSGWLFREDGGRQLVMRWLERIVDTDLQGCTLWCAPGASLYYSLSFEEYSKIPVRQTSLLIG